MISKTTTTNASIDRYGVIGYPISHSRSPQIHRLFALQTKQSLRYEPLENSPKELEAAVRDFQRMGGKGLNITVPHKTEVIKLVDKMSERASTAGAVNTLSFKSGEIYGDNTDGIGLLRDLTVNLSLSVENANILILGAGGATRGIVALLLEMRPKSLTIANRSLDKAEALAVHFSHLGPISACAFNAVPNSHPYDLIINATSAGVKGEMPSYPSGAISNATYCYDLSYGLNPTPFSVWARKAGARESIMGWGMLVEQAAESFNLWRGVRPNTAPVIKEISINA
ncbi:MAG: shikimate dehydrogenase [Woeseiaceae bacterium]|nr:shikimate dehydrogenase [Woeseiaceae bacterium]